MTTLAINFDFKDLFKEDEWNSIEEKYSCTICNELVYKQEWYQCKEGHTGCSNCWNKIISEKGTKQCPFCRKPVKSLNDLSRCRFVEQEFLNKMVLCPYSKKMVKDNKLVHDTENGCKEIITIEQLDNHQKNCNSRFVKCDNKGCGTVSRYCQYLQHEKECGHSTMKCELCKKEIKRSSLKKHQKSCPPQPKIKCTQCTAELKNPSLKHHIDNECPNTIIPCKFQQHGCKNKFKRSELSSHLQQVNHTEFMLNLIDKQSQQLHQQSKQLQKQSQQLNEYKAKFTQQSKQLKELKESNNKLGYILDTLKQNTIYSNKWVISNFNERAAEGKPPIYSPEVFIAPYKFVVFTVYDSEIKKQYFFMKGLFEGKVKTIYTFKLLNCMDFSKNMMIKFEYDFSVNGRGWGGPFSLDQFSKESGYVFPDGSVQIEFTIEFEKPSLLS